MSVLLGINIDHVATLRQAPPERRPVILKPLRTLTARALQEHGYQVRPASSGPEMWVAFDAGPVDLVVLDVMLPGTNGIDLCRQIRWWREQPLLQLGFTQILWQRPAKLRLSSTPQILAHSGATDAAGCGNLPVTQPSLPLEAKDFFDFTHG